MVHAGHTREQKLVEAARRGDERAFRRLVEPHQDRLRSRCYRVLRSQHDADDALQETLVRAWRGLDGLDGNGAVGPWLHRIATNSSIDALHRRRRSVPVDASADPDATSAGATASPAVRYEQREALEAVFATVVNHLPERQRDALILDALGYSAGEAAQALDTTRTSVYSALQRARAAIAN
jgi:RNA polymerase sigma-70 factor (ECF subfamily)